MALLPYTLKEPVGAISPLVVDSPHSGRIYPADFAYACPLHLLRQAEDAFVDEIVVGAAEAGATVVMAEFPRSMIDANRAENDIDPAALDGVWPEALAPDPMTVAGFGLVRRLCRNGVTLYGSPLTVTEVRRRIDVYYRPYHECLRKIIASRMATFGACTFIDAHSMPDRVENGVPRPDFILGDRDGTSCDPVVARCAQKILQGMGYRVALNDPYKGREIVQRYGLSGQGAQALQIEVNRKLYMNEIKIEKHDGFDQLRRNMTTFFQTLTATVHSEMADRVAAE
jgi:N-formylglutamate amidohydrolase